MRERTKKLIISTLCVAGFLLPSALFAQNTLNVSSHSALINGITFDYSIGEMTLISTEKTANLIVTQGFIQPNGTSKAGNGGSESTMSNLENLIKVYPNPTSDLLFVESYESAAKDYTYHLYDVAGKIVLSSSGQTREGLNKFSLDLQGLAAGSYYLMVQKTDARNQIQNFSYKIQKVN